MNLSQTTVISGENPPFLSKYRRCPARHPSKVSSSPSARAISSVTAVKAHSMTSRVSMTSAGVPAQSKAISRRPGLGRPCPCLVVRFYGDEEARRTVILFLFGDRSRGAVALLGPCPPAAACRRCRGPRLDRRSLCRPEPGSWDYRSIRSRRPHYCGPVRGRRGLGPLDYLQSLRIE